MFPKPNGVVKGLLIPLNEVETPLQVPNFFKFKCKKIPNAGDQIELEHIELDCPDGKNPLLPKY